MHLNAHADSMNELLLPGKVIQGHAKLESDCGNCHKQFDKAAQSGLCKGCHKEIAKDIAEKHGFHGKIEEDKPCKDCHTEHKGRDARISKVDTSSFDHNKQTNFELKGGHLKSKVQCKDCHVAGKKYREAPTNCFGCHERNDKHKGRFGKDCQNCHDETSWKHIRFDHNKSDFPLLGKHADVKCEACHIGNKFKGTPKECYACHKKDDAKAHHGKYGQKCEKCHSEKGWKDIRFDHAKETRFPLLGKHEPLKCTECHKGDLLKDKLQMACVSCHKKEDTKAHQGKYGPKCESCHTERGWKEIIFDHGKQTKFPLLGKHEGLKCTQCHKGDLHKDKLKTDCYSCHQKDDKHKGQEGRKCEACHNEKTWKKSDFDHRMARFPLTGKHLLVECKKCHVTDAFRDAKSDCYSCHEKKDVHKRRLGTDCAYCHNTRDWRDWDFDHDKTGFKLDGKHKDLKCIECHTNPVSNKITLGAGCATCHSKDDKHDGAFGDRCERCHVGNSWKVIKVGAQRWINR